ncbi:hypothetical protein MXD60_08840 [Frankia sp. AgB32]|nr:hypothetical protein [Frankia sp. AgB32]
MRRRFAAAGALAGMLALTTAGLVSCDKGSACAAVVTARGAGGHGGHSSSHGGSHSGPHVPHPVVVHPGGSHCG